MSSYASRDSDILAALQRGDVLTPAVAHSRWGVLALHSAIARLRKLGHVIPCKMVNGHGEYTLSASAPSAPKAIGDIAKASAAEPHERMIEREVHDKNGAYRYTLRYVAVGVAKEPAW